MSGTKHCPKCERTLLVEKFGWRDKAHTTRQGWCRTCLNGSRTRSKNRLGRDGHEHLRNHYDIALTLCGKNAQARPVASHYYDETPATELPQCADCARIDERACIEAEVAQQQPRGPFVPNPYRTRYLETVARFSLEQQS